MKYKTKEEWSDQVYTQLTFFHYFQAVSCEMVEETRGTELTNFLIQGSALSGI